MGAKTIVSKWGWIAWFDGYQKHLPGGYELRVTPGVALGWAATCIGSGGVSRSAIGYSSSAGAKRGATAIHRRWIASAWHATQESPTA